MYSKTTTKTVYASAQDGYYNLKKCRFEFENGKIKTNEKDYNHLLGLSFYGYEEIN